VERPGREFDYESASNAEVNEWSSTPITIACLYGVHRDNFTFYIFHLKIEGVNV